MQSDTHVQRLLAELFSTVECCFTSTEIIRLIRDGEPRTAISTVTQLLSSDRTVWRATRMYSVYLQSCMQRWASKRQQVSTIRHTTGKTNAGQKHTENVFSELLKNVKSTQQTTPTHTHTLSKSKYQSYIIIHSGTPFLSLSGIRLHSLKSKLKTHLFSSAYWSVVLPIHQQ